MTPFAAPLDDMLFCLEAVGRPGGLPGWDGSLATEIARHFASFAEGEIAPLDAPGDRQGARLVDGRVRMPDGFATVYRALAGQGWQGLTAPEALGGQGAGPLVGALTSEIFSGANQSLQMITGLVPGAVRTLLAFGSAEQQARLIPPLVSGAWLSTMCLTEPEAGSDLSRIRTRAVREGDGWRIEGEKIFISGGDQDLSEGILHLVLARTSDAGVKGLSLFACTGREGIAVTRIEDKMGLHASPTCQMRFSGASADLIGPEGDGLRAMFTMMNHARLDVALQGVAHAARAADVARRYAAERRQGRGPDGAEASLDTHGDVRRMIDRADALAMGARGIAHLAFVTMECGEAAALVDFLTPLAKVHCTEAGIEAAGLGMQVLGGYGYLREYRLEQTCRDVRVTAIYEGANGIHERALATRLLGGAPGAAFSAFLAAEPGAGIVAPRAVWEAARSSVAARADAADLAHELVQIARQALLSVVWTRMADAAGSHPRPERIRRLAAAALRESAIMARSHALRAGLSG
ncbi:acyl-CoA dehydrogenase family protein [Salipiger sp.]|uniref:acyl-CoA dehydrogenase family protein n=1 Tax=Salipiger sp. TaxID=2078585 RepID=UPI003A9752EF